MEFLYMRESGDFDIEYWSAHPVIKMTAKRVYIHWHGEAFRGFIILDRAALEKDGSARAVRRGYDDLYYTAIPEGGRLDGDWRNEETRQARLEKERRVASPEHQAPVVAYLNSSPVYIVGKDLI
jgi:hypothetical protein